MKVKEFMRRDLAAVDPETPVATAIYIMEKTGLHSLPMLDEEGKLIGVISEHDLIQAALPWYFEMLQSTSFIPDIDQLGRRLEEMREEPVANYVNPEVIAVRADDSDLQAADVLIRKGLHQLPVVDEEWHLIGVVRRIDLLARLTHRGVPGPRS